MTFQLFCVTDEGTVHVLQKLERYLWAARISLEGLFLISSVRFYFVNFYYFSSSKHIFLQTANDKRYPSRNLSQVVEMNGLHFRFSEFEFIDKSILILFPSSGVKVACARQSKLT